MCDCCHVLVIIGEVEAVTSPRTLPPGPKRRDRMLAIGMNLSDGDFTDAELAAKAAEAARQEDSAEKNSRPIADLYRVTS